MNSATMPTIHHVGPQQLDAIKSTFLLNETELARLFGVSRAAVDKWRERNVPAERAADVDRVRELADVFVRKFVPERVPQIVRTPGKGLDGKTVLQVISEAGVEPVYAYLEGLFAYTPS